MPFMSRKLKRRHAVSAPITPLEALEDLVVRLAGSGFTDDSGRPFEQTDAFRSAMAVLDDRLAEEPKSFAPREH